MGDDFEVVERDETDPNLAHDEVQIAENLARKAPSGDGECYVFTVAYDVKKRVQGGDSLITFAIAAKGPHSSQKCVLIRDNTAQPNRLYPWIIQMKTVEGTLLQITSGDERKDFGGGFVEGIDSRLLEHHRTSDAVVVALKLRCPHGDSSQWRFARLRRD
jgi:hypothetical protein